MTAKILVPTILIFGLLISCGSPNFNAAQRPSESDTIANVSNVKPELRIVFDLPPLIGKNIDEVRKVLGKPVDTNIEPSKQQKKMGLDKWENLFEKEGYDLLVTFNPQSRKVKDLYIETNDPSGIPNDFSDLLKIGNLTNESSRYFIQGVASGKDTTRYIGIKVMPKEQ